MIGWIVSLLTEIRNIGEIWRGAYIIISVLRNGYGIVQKRYQ